MKQILFASVLVAIGGLGAGPASAHAFLTTASPAVGSTIAASPAQIRLNFTEGLEAPFSGVEITGPGGARDFGKARISGKQMTVPVRRPLPAGAYRVTWHATAVDTHKTHGAFTFTIKR